AAPGHDEPGRPSKGNLHREPAMRIPLPLILVAIALAALVLLPEVVSCARAEEISSADGRLQQGQLILNTDGRLQLRLKESGTVLNLQDTQIVRFAEVPLPPYRPGIVHCLTLADDQRLSGEFLRLSEEEVQFRTAWGQQVSVPRYAVKSITHPPG